MSRGRNGSSLQYFCLENAMDRGAWQATAHGVARRWAWLSTWHGTLTTRHYSMRPLLARLDFHHSFSICYITIICMMWLAHNQYKLLRLNNMHLNFIFKLYKFYQVSLDILGSLNGSRVCLQCWRPGFDPWVRKIPWRRKWQSTLVILPRTFHGRSSLIGYSPWCGKELDTTERLYFYSFTFFRYLFYGL